MKRLVSALLVIGLVGPVAWGQEAPPRTEGGETASQVSPSEGDGIDVLESVKTALGLNETSVRIRGGLTAGYTYSLADPEAHRDANALRLSDPDHNSFGLTHGSIGLERQVRLDRDYDLGFGADLVVGRIVERAFDDGLLRSGAFAIGQANVKLKTPVPGGLTIGVGKEYGWFGLESIDLNRNFHHSLSYAIESAPRTVTGLSARIHLAEGVSYTQYLSNGSDLAIDDNDSKSLGGQLRFESERGMLSLNYFLGAERLGSESDLNWIAEAAGSYQLSDVFSIGGLVRVGQEEVNGRTHEFGLLQALARADLMDGLFSVGGRVSLLHDEDGMVTGQGQKLLELTLTAELRPVEALSVGVEYRHDHSSEDAFAGSAGAATRSTQDTVSAFVRLRF